MVCAKTRRMTWCFFTVFLFIAAPAAAAENMRVAHPSLSSSVICLLLANKEGYYREEGLNVEFLSIRGEIAIRTALAGEVDFFTNAGSALAAAARNVPVKILAVFQDRPGWDLIAHAHFVRGEQRFVAAMSKPAKRPGSSMAALLERGATGAPFP